MDARAGPEVREIAGEVALVAVLTGATAWLSVRFEWMESLFAWTRTRERFQVDELVPVLLTLAMGLVWIAVRRYRHARSEADARRRLADRFVRLQEDERKSLARELHDEMGQYLNAIKLDAVSLRDADPGMSPATRESARAIVRSVDHVQSSVAALIRRLRPVGLDELGLAAAIEHCVEGWRARLPATRFELALDPDIDSLDEARSLAIYRVVQEALTNCARHAQAGRVAVALSCRGPADDAAGRVALEVRDDGAGAPPSSNAARLKAGLGLAGMRERMAALGGTLEACAIPGGGFLVQACLPRCAPEASRP